MARATGTGDDPVTILRMARTILCAEDAVAVADHQLWLRSAGRAPQTISDRTRHLIRLSTWLAAQNPPATLLTATDHHLASWQVSIGGLSIETICTYLGHTRGFYLWLHRFRTRQDVTGLLTSPRKPRRLPHPIPDDELSGALRNADGPMLVCLLMMCMCGLRVGEVARLIRRDIRDTDAPPIVVVHGKGGKTRIVRLPGTLPGVLRQAGMPLTGPVVSGADGRAFTANRLSQIVNAHLHLCGSLCTAHSLRHWYGTFVYRRTGDLRLVQEMLGHASPTTTAGYAAYAPQHAEDAATGLDQAMADLLGRAGLRAVGDG